MSEILALKNGVTQKFTQRQWEIMGTDKMGWLILPNELKQVYEDLKYELKSETGILRFLDQKEYGTEAITQENIRPESETLTAKIVGSSSEMSQEIPEPQTRQRGRKPKGK